MTPPIRMPTTNNATALAPNTMALTERREVERIIDAEECEQAQYERGDGEHRCLLREGDLGE